MAVLSTVASIGLGLVGLGLQFQGNQIQAGAARNAAAASKRQEDLRAQQMALESARQRRAAIRNTIRARSVALSGATEQGAGSGSGIQGGFAQINNQGISQVQGINQAQTISTGIFSTNKDIADAQAMSSFGSGLSSLGGALFSTGVSIGQRNA